MEPILITKGITKSFGGLVAVDGVDICVEGGKLTLLMGPNGSGKTTLVNVITGFYKPDRGRVIFEGRDITDLPPNERYVLGLVRTFQIPSPFSKLSVLENVMVAARNSGEAFSKAPIGRTWRDEEWRIADRALRILDLLELSDLWDKPAQTLSGGQLKLLEIGRALMTGAKLILMDEPAAGINPTLAHKIFSHMMRIMQKMAITFFIVEHRLEVVSKYVDYVYVMDRGRVISQGSFEEVLNDIKVVEAYLGG